MEGISKYVNALEDYQKQSMRPEKTITADTLLLIATNSMLLTEHFPWSEENWEDLSKDENDWSAWKELYNADDWKEKFNKQAVGGQDQFDATHGAAYGAIRQVPPNQQSKGPTRSAADLEEYFDALAAAATTKKGVLEYIVKDNAALTTTNTELSASVVGLIKDNKQLSRQVSNWRNNNHIGNKSPAPCPKTLCCHCKIKVMHAPDNCFELKKNATRFPRG